MSLCVTSCWAGYSCPRNSATAAVAVPADSFARVEVVGALPGRRHSPLAARSPSSPPSHPPSMNLMNRAMPHHPPPPPAYLPACRTIEPHAHRAPRTHAPSTSY